MTGHSLHLAPSSLWRVPLHRPMWDCLVIDAARSARILQNILQAMKWVDCKPRGEILNTLITSQPVSSGPTFDQTRTQDAAFVWQTGVKADLDEVMEMMDSDFFLCISGENWSSVVSSRAKLSWQSRFLVEYRIFHGCRAEIRSDVVKGTLWGLLRVARCLI